MTAPSCCVSVNPTRTLRTIIPSWIFGANGIPDSRDGARAAVGCDRARIYTYPRPACSAGREKDAIACGGQGGIFRGTWGEELGLGGRGAGVRLQG